MAVRSPQLYEALRRHCLGAFAYLYRASQDEAPLPFSFEEHAAPGRPALYEYRPRARSYVEDRAEELRRLDDAQFALEELRREPAAAIFAHAHAGEDTTEESALYRTILLPFLAGLAERCGGFEWDDQVFNRGYDKLEREIFGDSHAYGAVAPLVGISCPVQVDLGRRLQLRLAEPGEIADYWPEANGLLPPGFGQEPERTSVIELSCVFAAGAVEPPDAPGEIADAVTALRLATAAPIAAGPVLFERLDWRPYGVRPGAADRRHRASGRGNAPRRVPGQARGRPPRTARRVRPRRGSRRGASTAGSCRCSRPSRTARSSCASRSARCSAAATGSGRPPPGSRCSSATTLPSGPSCSPDCAA